MSWDPSQYLRFADQRRRPAIDLLARIGAENPARVYDLGCGPGNVTKLLAQRWPGAKIIGIDSSAAMLEKARAEAPGIEWRRADLAHWTTDHPVDVLYSNAAIQWIDATTGCSRRWSRRSPRAGLWPCRLPRNHGAPSHTGMAEGGARRTVGGKAGTAAARTPVQPPDFYYDVLARAGLRPDIWEVEYLQQLDGENAVTEWTKGTALKPLLDALDDPCVAGFLADYTARMAAAYPRRADGITLFPFRRLFIVAVKS